MFLILALLQLLTRPDALYAWTKEELAQKNALCSQVKQKKESSEKEKNSHKKNMEMALSHKKKADGISLELNPKIKIYKELEGQMAGTIYQTDVNLKTMGAKVAGLKDKTQGDVKDFYFNPTFQWLCQARNCLYSQEGCPSLSPPQTGCRWEMGSEGKNFGNIETHLYAPGVETTQTKGAGTIKVPVKEIQGSLAKLPAIKTQMKSLEPDLIRLGNSYVESLEHSEAFMGESLKSLEAAKEHEDSARRISGKADQLMQTENACQKSFVDYSEEAARLAKETEELLKLAQRL